MSANLSIVLSAALLFGAESQQALATLPQEPAEVLATDQLRDAVWKDLLRADGHVRYYETMADRFRAKASGWRWASIWVGLASFGLPLIFYFAKSKKWQVAWSLFGLLACGVSFYDALSTDSDSFNQCAVLEKRWNALKYDLEDLYIHRDEIQRDELDRRYSRLASEKRAIESAEMPGEAGPELEAAFKEAIRVRVPTRQSSTTPAMMK